LRGTYLLSGFPWSSLGYSQYKTLPVIQIADITGVYGVSFLVVMINGTVTDILTYRKERKLALLLGSGFSIILFVIALIYGYSSLKESVPSQGKR